VGLVAFVIIGIIVGGLAGNIVNGHGFGGVSDLFVGVLGSLLGGFIFDILGIPTYGFLSSALTSVVGAVLFLSMIGYFRDMGRGKDQLIR